VLEHHAALVRRVALHYNGLGVPTEDLMQEGAIGLLRAIDGFDPARGAEFGAYAVWPVRAVIGRAVLRRGRFVRVPRSVLHRPDTLADPALAAPVSLDAPAEPGGAPLEAVLPDPHAPDPEEEALRHEREDLLRAAIEHLPPRRREVIERHYGLDGDPQSLGELAADLHVSRQRTQALRNQGLSELAAELAPLLEEEPELLEAGARH
jgi:RNA polymerase sigma factor (sigma-70 family)